MGEISAGKVIEFKDGDRRIVSTTQGEIGVLRIGDEFVAYNNVCPHQGGPICEGMLIHKVEEVIAPDRTFHGFRFSPETLHLVCPWHSWEFDVRTGACAGDGKHRLRRYRVTERDGEVFVLI
jgi:nitrite reductase (NADH) small subunit